jgi:hypothetical protein
VVGLFEGGVELVSERWFPPEVDVSGDTDPAVCSVDSDVLFMVSK